MDNCLGLGPLPEEYPSEWPIVVRRIFTGLIIFGLLAFLGLTLRKVITKEVYIHILMASVCVILGAAVWRYYERVPQPVFAPCPLCGRWELINDCCVLPVSKQLVCKACAEW